MWAGLAGLVASATAMVGGVLWDISWDASIGVDSFWSPPHVATNFGACAAGLFGLLLLFATRGEQGGAVVRVGFGAGLAAWGAVAMLGFLILDDWWGRSYGIYGERWSPPEILFTLAAAAILAGAGTAAAAANAALAALWVAALAAAFAVAAMTPYGIPNLQRTSTFYLASSLPLPLLLSWAAAVDRRRWSATLAALLYSGFVAALVWTLPRFAAQPQIGPIYQPVESLIPPSFPLLLFLPALAVDVCARRSGATAARGVACGLAFLAAYVPVQWVFSSFLLSPGADNWFFAGGGRYWPFYFDVGPERTAFWGLDGDSLSLAALATSAALAALAAAIGLSVGEWARGERR